MTAPLVLPVVTEAEKVVPLEPTEEMVRKAHASTAGWLNLPGVRSALSQALIKHAHRYRHMVNAAPPSRTVTVSVEELDAAYLAVYAARKGQTYEHMAAHRAGLEGIIAYLASRMEQARKGES